MTMILNTQMIKATLYPKVRPSSKHWYAYDVVFDGDLIVTDSRDPEHELARALMARGVTGTVTLLDGNTGTPRTMVNIEKAAKFSADSNGRVRPWKPFEPAAVRGYSPETDLVLPTLPGSDDKAAA